jgi:hypothetical protein
MKRETLKEVGKGLITFGNSVGALSIINGLFNNNQNLPAVFITMIVIYLIVGSYIAGIIFLEKGADSD